MEEQKNPTLYERLLKTEWSYYTGAVMITILALCLALFSGTWGASGPFFTWFGKFVGLFGIDTNSWAIYNGSLEGYKFFGNQASMTDIGLLLGALISCLLAAQWKIRKIKHWKQVAAAVIGGLCMGFGAKIAGRCNIGALFSSLPQFNLSGWIFLLFVFLGATAGGRLLRNFFEPPVSNKRPNRKRLTAEQRKQRRMIQIALGVVLTLVVVIVSFVVAPSYPKAPGIIFVGISLGYVMQRSRFCFTAAYRDPGLTGETKLTRAVIVALALSTILFFGIQASKYGIDLAGLESTPGGTVNLALVIGSFIFGIGAVLAGGCASGTFVRMGEGYLQNYIAFVFFACGSALGECFNLATKGTFVKAGSPVYLPEVFGGMMPALFIQLLALLALWILAYWWEQKKIAQRNAQSN